uniref:F-box domain-containing protein n=1 Tax=Clandestinovirus TaxID=2831644 RepID=A0A8F8KQZ0_9VIRU|nr:F-box domain-containing protein [Clandestinovirus]
MSWYSLFPVELVLHVLDYTTPTTTINLARTCKKLYNHQKIDEIFNRDFNPIIQKIHFRAFRSNRLWLFPWDNANICGKKQYAAVMKNFRDHKKEMDKEMFKRLAWAIVEHPLDTLVELYGGTVGAFLASYLGGTLIQTASVSMPILCISTLILSRPIGEVAKQSLVMGRNLSCTLILPPLLFAQVFKVWSAEYSVWTVPLMSGLATLFATRQGWFAKIKQAWKDWDTNIELQQFMVAKHFGTDLIVPM